MPLRLVSLTLASALLVFASGLGFAQPGPQWIGTWKMRGADESFTISTESIEYFGSRKLEPDSPPEEYRFSYKWTNQPPEQAGDSVFDSFGYMSKPTTREKISKRYEDALSQYERDPTDFSVSEPKESRKHITTLPDGRFKAIWAYGQGDCDFSEYIVNGNNILEVNECKYGMHIRMLDRYR